eukprot:2963112-Pyramimonas_sp.AAC.3
MAARLQCSNANRPPSLHTFLLARIASLLIRAPSIAPPGPLPARISLEPQEPNVQDACVF